LILSIENRFPTLPNAVGIPNANWNVRTFNIDNTGRVNLDFLPSLVQQSCIGEGY
jgi:hypothetical protein